MSGDTLIKTGSVEFMASVCNKFLPEKIFIAGQDNSKE